ncbi:TRAP transporter substrate-binding protein DctP [Bacillus sp. 1P10SD]|uniref:TRAP transporter substrate-binding protein n=1 Tax=Bacillus sp. 1P10SD TaxID=3132265 RepID=UPI0039A778DE
MRKGFKKWLLVFLTAFVAVGMAACGNSEKTGGGSSAKGENKGGKKDEQIVIKIADSFPSSHLIPKTGTLPWIDRIEELGKGKIKIEYYPAEQLGKAASLLDAAKNGVADIAYVGPLYVSDKMPLSGVAGNPGLVKDAVSGSKAFNKLIKDDLYELEFKPNGVRPLWGATTNPYQIVNSVRKVTKASDFKGLKIRTSGGLQEEMMQKLGATPVSVPGPEIFSAWDRGTIEGTLLSFFSWPGYQTDKVAKYSSRNAQLSAFGITYVVNEKSWKSWPKDVQDAITQASDEIVEQMAKAIIKDEADLEKQYKGAGVEIYDIPEADLEKLNAELEPFNKKWAKDLDAKGLQGTKILEKFREYNKEYQQ